jgi:drug/metabolite transporter (DMT)-like permease
LIAWPLFGERLGPAALLGMALTLAGVMLAMRPGPLRGFRSRFQTPR